MLREVIATGQPIVGHEVATPLPGQRTRHWHTSYFPVEQPSGARGVGIAVEEISTRKQAQEHLELLLEAKALLAGALDDDTVLDRLARLLAPRLADFCAVDVLGDDGALHLAAVAHADPAKEALVRALHRVSPPRPEDTIGATQVTRTGRAELLSVIGDETLAAGARSPEHLQIMRDLNLRSAMIVPMRAGERAIGAVTLVSTDPIRRYDTVDLSLAQAIADRAGLAIDVAIRHRAERARAERARVLAEAGALLASSLDGAVVVERIARLLVPALVDSCSIELVDGDGRPDRFVAADADPRREAHILDVRRRHPPRIDTHPSFEVMRTGRPRLVVAERDAFVQRLAHDADHQQELRSLAVSSLLLVPLLARGRAVGCMALGLFDRTFSPDDVAFFEDLALRAALAVDNARLHEAERRARLEAEQANRAKDEFLGVVSHELRTPLNAVLGWASLLRARAPSDPHVARGLEVIERNARAQAKIIEDILDVSRITAGRMTLARAPVDLAGVLRAAVEGVRVAAEAKGLAIEVRAGGDVPAVLGDADRLQQVLSNLLVNAVKFTPPRGRIEAAIEPAPGAVRVQVADTGIGIDPAVLPHLFERFRQAGSSPSRRHGGLGLGLAIVRNLVELHGGEVTAESAGLGHGARFTISLPVAPAPAAPRLDPGEDTAAPPPGSLSLLRVLVVNDEPDAREVIAALLAARGAVPLAVGSAGAALDALADFGPDVILSDLGMPGEDGFTLLRRVRTLPSPLARVPAVALTAYTRDEDAERALAAGFFAHVPKPVDPARMTAALARATGRTAG